MCTSGWNSMLANMNAVLGQLNNTLQHNTLLELKLDPALNPVTAS